MEKKEAMRILSVCHRNDAGRSDDAEIQEAFALLAKDEDIRAWFEREQEFDTAIRESLGKIAPPADLRDSLVSHATPKVGSVSNFRMPSVIWAAAAVVLGIFAISQWLPDSRTPVTNQIDLPDPKFLRRDLISLVSRKEMMLSAKAKTFGPLQQWLDDQGYRIGEIAEQIKTGNFIGCRLVPWGDQQIAAFCMKNGSDQVVHVFVFDVTLIEGAIDPQDWNQTSLCPVTKLESQGWMDDSHGYLVIGNDESVRVGEFF